MLHYIRFPFPREGSGDFAFNLMPDSLPSADFSDFSTTFPHGLLSLPDLAGDIAPEAVVRPLNIWQSRAFEDVKLEYFDCAALGPDCAAFASTPFGGTIKQISVISSNSQLRRHNLETDLTIEAMCVDMGAVWALHSAGIIRLAFDSGVRSARVTSFGSGNIASFVGGAAIVGYASSPLLYFVPPAFDVRQISLSHRGVTCLTGFGRRILCGITGSGSLRLIGLDGKEERAFVGHCGQVMGVERLGEATFASRGEDETVRIWDVREKTAVACVLLPRVSVTTMTGSKDVVVCGFHTKRIGVVDLRSDGGKAVLGVQTQDYVPIALRFDQGSDSLAMFGVVEKEPIQSSMVFVDNDGQSRQRIFRTYSHFMGEGAGEAESSVKASSDLPSFA
jgi:hypothetical protein